MEAMDGQKDAVCMLESTEAKLGFKLETQR
jgi:hypothetical protein